MVMEISSAIFSAAIQWLTDSTGKTYKIIQAAYLLPDFEYNAVCINDANFDNYYSEDNLEHYFSIPPFKTGTSPITIKIN